MSNEMMIPEHLKKYMSNPAASSEADSMAAASISIPRISLRGRKFRLIVGGEEIQKPSDEVFVVILAVEPGAGLMQKTYYKKGYASGDSAPPDCSSSDGVVPDSWVNDPVNPTCRNCPMGVFGSAVNPNNGKKTKACKDSKRLWVALPNDIGGTVFAMNVPVTSLKAMAEYGQMLKTNNIPTAAVMTKLSMKDSEFPELIFEFAGVLAEEVLETSMARNEAKDWGMRQSGPLLDHRPSGPIAAPGADKLLEGTIAETKPQPGAAIDPDAATAGW